MIVRKVGAFRGEGAETPQGWFDFLDEPVRGTKSEAPSSIEAFKERRIAPNSGPRFTREVGEVVTYVREGSLVYEDSTKIREIMRAGAFHRTTLGPGFHYQETNASPVHWAHVFQIWFASDLDAAPGHEHELFSSAERRHGLCLVASPDGRDRSLTVHQDAFLYSAIVPIGSRIVHPLSHSRSAYLCVIEGEVRIAELTLRARDTAVLTNEGAVSFSATKHSEVLLLDLGAPGERTLESARRPGKAE